MEYIKRKVFLTRNLAPFDTNGDGKFNTLRLMATTKVLQIPLTKTYDDIGIYDVDTDEKFEIIDIGSIWDDTIEDVVLPDPTVDPIVIDWGSGEGSITDNSPLYFCDAVGATNRENPPPTNPNGGVVAVSTPCDDGQDTPDGCCKFLPGQGSGDYGGSEPAVTDPFDLEKKESGWINDSCGHSYRSNLNDTFFTNQISCAAGQELLVADATDFGPGYNFGDCGSSEDDLSEGGLFIGVKILDEENQGCYKCGSTSNGVTQSDNCCGNTDVGSLSYCYTSSAGTNSSHKCPNGTLHGSAVCCSGCGEDETPVSATPNPSSTDSVHHDKWRYKICYWCANI